MTLLRSMEQRRGTEVAKHARRAQSHGARGTVADVESSALFIELLVRIEDPALLLGDTEQPGHLLDLVRLASTHDAPLMLAILIKRPLPIQTLEAHKTRPLRPQLFEDTTVLKGRVPTSFHRTAIAHEALAIGNRERHASCSLSTTAKCATQLSAGNPRGVCTSHARCVARASKRECKAKPRARQEHASEKPRAKMRAALSAQPQSAQLSSVQETEGSVH